MIAECQNDDQGNYRGDHFCHSAAYLSHLTFEGAKKRYGEVLTEEYRERLEYELQVICRKGYQDYFLFIQDVVTGVKAMGSMVGPGRSSSAGLDGKDGLRGVDGTNGRHSIPFPAISPISLVMHG